MIMTWQCGAQIDVDTSKIQDLEAKHEVDAFLAKFFYETFTTDTFTLLMNDLAVKVEDKDSKQFDISLMFLTYFFHNITD